MTTRNLIAVCALLLLPYAGAVADPRQAISLNPNWSFLLERSDGDE